jgi:lipoprotein-anchoring transpeptidase ErfK/SrfK
MKSHHHALLIKLSALLVSASASNIACKGSAPNSPQLTVEAQTLKLVDRPVVARSSPTVTPVHYRALKIQGRKSVAELESRLGSERFAMLLKINRKDRSHIRTSDVLVIPDGDADLIGLSPFPVQLEVAGPIVKLILVSRRSQVFAAYESGRLVRWGPTSTGKKSTPTPIGLYHTNWRARETRSTVNSNWRLPWCFNLDNQMGVSFHQYDLPGYPASHGCVRLLREDAKWIYDWADQWMLSKANGSLLSYGTPVVIFGDYSYGKNAPWKRLEEDPNATAISLAEIEQALTKYLPSIQSRARQRESLIADLLKPNHEL